MSARQVIVRGYYAVRKMHIDMVRWERECFPEDQWSRAARENSAPSVEAMLNYVDYYDLMPPEGTEMGPCVTPPRMLHVNKRPPPMKTWTWEKMKIGKK